MDAFGFKEVGELGGFVLTATVRPKIDKPIASFDFNTFDVTHRDGCSFTLGLEESDLEVVSTTVNVGNEIEVTEP